MILKKKNARPSIDLDGPQGNAYFLLGTAQKYAKQLNLNPDDILSEMKQGDYNNLLITFEKYFGDYVNLETENEEYLALLTT